MHPFNRRWHRRISIFIALPFTLIVFTGICLATRSFNPWIATPLPEIKSELAISFPEILAIAQNIPEANIRSWQDIKQIQAQPKTGIIRIRTNEPREIAIDGKSGAVLSNAPYKVGFLVSLHEGAFFGDFVRYGIFLPSAVGVFFLLISGVVIYIQGFRAKRRGNR